jgi:quercetin dioxygenase-like cupin family protein
MRVEETQDRASAYVTFVFSVPEYEVLQTRIEFVPGMAFGRHRHPIEEIVHVIEGSLQCQVEGQPAVTLNAGDVLFIPAGTIHAVKNVGGGNGSELANASKREAPRREVEVSAE